jgi:uncharacterized protein DUF4157
MKLTRPRAPAAAAPTRGDSASKPSSPTTRPPAVANLANPLWSLLTRGTISRQAKLRVGAVDDPLEREANRVAEAVTSGAAAPSAVQRKCAACEEEEMHRSPAELPAEDEEEKLQTKRSSGAAPEVSPKTASRIASFRGSGEALSPAARSYFEPRFGRDLSSVRLHTDPEAATAASEVAARAFTVGRDIAFGAGEYRPETQEGKKLLAHELTHTLQQSASPGPGADVVRRQRTTVPPRPFDDKPRPPPLSPGAERILEQLGDIITTVVTSLLPYTQGTKTALIRVQRWIHISLGNLEELQLIGGGKARLRRLTEHFVKKLKAEVARSPEKDPYQEGNILRIGRRWYQAFEDQLEIELKIGLELELDPEHLPERVKELLDKLKKQPPLDLPKQEDSGQWLA